VDALRAASEAEATPSCTEVAFTLTWDLKRGGSRHVHPDPRDACFALSSASVLDFSRVRRVRRLGLGPRSHPADLAIDPAIVTGEEASMRPAVVAYRLLQPKKTMYEHTHELRPSHRDGDRNPLRVLYDVVTCPSRGAWPTCREPRKLPRHPRCRFPLKIRLGDLDNTPVSTSTTPRDAVYRWSWFRGPGDQVKVCALLSGVRELPSSATPVHPIVTGWSSAGPERLLRPNRNRSRPSLDCPPAKRSRQSEDQGAFRRQQLRPG